MSFLEYSDRLSELIKYERIEDVILKISIFKLINLVENDINQNFHNGDSLLMCSLKTLQGTCDNNDIHKLTKKIMTLILKGAHCQEIYDKKILISLVTKCSTISNRTNFQIITPLGKIFDKLNINISEEIELYGNKEQKLWNQIFTHVQIIREHRNCINHIQDRNWSGFIEHFNLLLSLFTSDYTKNDWCFYNISHELSQSNWNNDELSLAELCIISVINMYPRMVCDIILNIDKHINIPHIMELCSKFYQSSYDSILLYGLHRHFMENTITSLIIDISLHYISNTEINLVFDPDFPVRRTLLHELQATQDKFDKTLLSYLEVSLFDLHN